MKEIVIVFLLFMGISGFTQNSYLVSPKDGQIVTDTSVVLCWDERTLQDSYQLTIATDGMFQNKVYDGVLVNKNIHEIHLQPYTTYYWFVNYVSVAMHSDTLSFTTFKPTDIDSLTLWLSADSLITKDASNKVFLIGDLSGNGHDAVQLDTNKQPIFNEYVYPFIDFRNGSKSLIGTLSNLKPGNYSRSLYLLADFSYLTSNYNSVYGNYYHGTANYKTFEVSLQPHRLVTRIGNNSQYTFSAYYTTLQSRGIVSINISDTTAFAYFNSTFLSSYAQAYYKSSIPNYIVGGRTSNGVNISHPFSGLIHEIIDYAKPLDSAEIQLVNKYLLHKYTPPVCVGPNILRKHSFCDTTLSTWAMYESYLWSTGDTTRNIQIAAQDTGWYWCEVPNLFGDMMRDSVYVYNLVPEAGLADTTICLSTNSDIKLPFNSDYTFDWKDANGLTVDTDSALQVSAAGRYVVKVTDSLGCFARDTVQVYVDSFAVEADLGIDKQVCTGEKLSLATGNAKAIGWLWNTGATDSIITIDTAGAYVLKVTDFNNCSVRDTIIVGIKGISPTVGFKVDSTCLNSNSIFIDTSFTIDASNIIQWDWEWGDGTSNQQLATGNQQHIFPDSGLYNVKLTATTDSGCVNYTYQPAWVHPLPEVAIGPLTGCENHEIEFQSQSTSPFGQLVDWSYDFGDGSNPLSISSSQALTHIYTQPGNYNLKHISTTEFGCKDSLIATVAIKPSPDADFVYTTSCEGELIYFSEQNHLTGIHTVLDRKWMFVGGDSSEIPSPSYNFGTEGYYNVSYFVKSTNGCWDTISKEVILHPNPIAEVSFGNVCEQTHATLNGAYLQNTTVPYNVQNYLWSIDGNNVSLTPHCNVYFNDTVNHEIVFKVVTSAGCEDTVTKNLKVHPNPIADFETDKEYGLPPLQVQFINNSQGATTYDWQFSDGQNSSLPEPFITFTDSAVHTASLIASTNFGCKDSVGKPIYAIYAAIDIAVANLQVDYQNGYLTYRCQVQNLGKRPVHELWLETGYNNQFSIREKWTGTLEQGATMNYAFSAQSPIENIEELKYFCIQAQVIGDQNDERLENNSYCQEYLEDIWLGSAYPNPVDDILTIDYILPLKSLVKVRLFDVNGQEKNTFEFKGDRGLNKLQIPTSHLSQGVYYLEIELNNSIEVREFVK